jgi:hypothetical protein
MLLLVALASSAHAAEVLVNDTVSEEDDYLCWAPIRLSVQLETGESSLQTVAIRSVGVSPNSGRVGFQVSREKPNSATLSLAETVSVPVSDGEVADVWVAGLDPSKNQKDVAVVVERSDGTEIGADSSWYEFAKTRRI